ncbi:MAG: serine/threonine-protein kinase [Myxococcota bacterium]
MDAALNHAENKVTDEILLELANDSTGSTSDDTLDAIGVPIPAFEGLVAAIERERVFEALFEASAPSHELGRYVVTGTLGRGAMGTVFKAFDSSLDRRVALKVLHKELDAMHTTRLLREAQALAKLSHPNVVQVYEVGEFEGQTFVAMELVKGKTLREWMRSKPRPGWRECLEVFLQVGAGLAAAHERGLVHRDFKPGNAIIDRKGRARVLDFGLARQVKIEDDDLSTMRRARTDEMDPVPLDIPITQPGAVLGTPAYMPLEQMYGQEADARSDQFSFCVALYEAIYGERPFQGITMTAQVISMTHGHFRPVPKGIKAPAQLRRVLLRGLAHLPGDRWPSMEALLVELRRLVAPRGRPWVALGLAFGLVVGLVVGLSVLGAGLSPLAAGSRCDGAREQLAGIWDEPRKQAVRKAFLSTRLSYAPRTLAWVEQQLDAYADAWTREYIEVCEGNQQVEKYAHNALDLPMSCLRERQVTLYTTVKTLANANVHVVDNAIDMVERLPAPRTCHPAQPRATSTR